VSTPSPRDRDPDGRPRNARPRDAAGRPLPMGAEGVTPVDETADRTPEQACDEAGELLRSGRPFAAHEVLEVMWKRADDPGDQALWRGLAQLMVGLTHHQRGNDVGAVTLLERGAESLPEGTHGPGIDADAWAAWGMRAAALVRRGDPPPPPPLLGRAARP